jgi:hypothetical protein
MDEPLVKRMLCSSARVNRISFVRACKKSFQRKCLWIPGGLEGWLPSGPTEMPAPCFAHLRATLPSAVRRADPSLCVRVLESTCALGDDTLVSRWPQRTRAVARLNHFSKMGFVPPLVSRHALHEKGLQKHKSAVTLVSMQQRRALAVPRMLCG